MLLMDGPVAHDPGRKADQGGDRKHPQYNAQGEALPSVGGLAEEEMAIVDPAPSS
ncbi:MAG: hypothetical protein R6U57_04770 [Anaerolineales bacterium]